MKYKKPEGKFTTKNEAYKAFLETNGLKKADISYKDFLKLSTDNNWFEETPELKKEKEIKPFMPLGLKPAVFFVVLLAASTIVFLAFQNGKDKKVTV